MEKKIFLHLHEIVERLYFHCSLSTVCVSVWICLWTKFQPNRWTDWDAVFAKWYVALVDLCLNFIKIEWAMTSLWHHLDFLQSNVHISNSIEPTNFVFGTNTQQHNVYPRMKMKMIFTDDEGHRRRAKVTKNELMVICRKLLHSQTSYLVPRYNTVSDI